MPRWRPTCFRACASRAWRQQRVRRRRAEPSTGDAEEEGGPAGPPFPIFDIPVTAIPPIFPHSRASGEPPFLLRAFASSREKKGMGSRPSTALQALRINLAFGQGAKTRRKKMEDEFPLAREGREGGEGRNGRKLDSRCRGNDGASEESGTTRAPALGWIWRGF